MSKDKYEFTNKYGLPILDDSPMDSKKMNAYFDYLEDTLNKESKKEKADNMQNEKVVKFA